MPDYGDVDPITGRTSARTEFEGTLDPNAPSVANGRITPEEYAQYQAKRRRDALFGVLGILGGTTGLSFLGNALGGASAVGSASVPGAVGASAPPLGGGTVTAGTLSATPFTSLAPYARTVANAGAGTNAGGGFMGMSGRDLAALAASLTGTVGGALAKKPNMAPNTMTSDPNLQKLLQTMQGRLDKSEPLYDSIMSMANGLLPTQYQKGGGGMG